MYFFVVFWFKYGGMGDQGMIDGGKTWQTTDHKNMFSWNKKKGNKQINFSYMYSTKLGQEH